MQRDAGSTSVVLPPAPANGEAGAWRSFHIFASSA